MTDFDKQSHWENIYKTRQFEDVSWYQQKPVTSLEFLHQFKVEKNAKIIDVGGGDSFLVDNLLELGYNDITVLDISATAILKAKSRLGDKAKNVKWIVADAANFVPAEKYDFWHDRAAFHFLTQEHEIEAYINMVEKSINKAGILVIGTFSENGPKKCSGIEIKQYSENALTGILKKFFEKIKCISVDHRTPFDTIQNFVFCSFRKRAEFG